MGSSASIGVYVEIETSCMRNKQINHVLGRREQAGRQTRHPRADCRRKRYCRMQPDRQTDLVASGLISNERCGVLPAFRLLLNQQQLGSSVFSQHIYLKVRPRTAFYILKLVPEAEIATKSIVRPDKNVEEITLTTLNLFSR